MHEHINPCALPLAAALTAWHAYSSAAAAAEAAATKQRAHACAQALGAATSRAITLVAHSQPSTKAACIAKHTTNAQARDAPFKQQARTTIAATQNHTGKGRPSKA